MNIKSFKATLLVVFVSIITFSSCNEDFLNPKPTDSIEDDLIFESYVTAEAALIGAYDQLSGSNFEGLRAPIMADIIGEDVMVNAVENWNWFVAVYQLNLLPNYTNVENPWWNAYKIIHDANKIIAKAQEVPDATETQRNALEGESRVIRAYTMLTLVEMYANAYSRNSEAPGILNVNIPTNKDSEDFGRASVAEIYTQITDDLLKAIDLLSDYTNKGFFDKRAAQAVLARAYLDMEEWEKASEMAKEAHKDLTLMSANEMLSGFSVRNSETIFSVAYTAEDNNVYLSIPSFYWPVAGYSSMRANDRFVELFSKQDIRLNYFILDPDIDPNRNLILKFSHNQQVGNAERISIRAAEMHLIEAECEAELGNNEEARDALYIVQKRSIGNAIKSTASGDALIQEILLERRKELFGEGFRWNDIKRRQTQFTREGDHWVKFDFGAQDEDYNRLTFPIPQSEIDANSKLTQDDQNPGY